MDRGKHKWCDYMFGPEAELSRAFAARAHRDSLVYLKGSYELIAGRVSHRVDHFAPAQLVASQFQDLEEPENALVVQVDRLAGRNCGGDSAAGWESPEARSFTMLG